MDVVKDVDWFDCEEKTFNKAVRNIIIRKLTQWVARGASGRVDWWYR